MYDPDGYLPVPHVVALLARLGGEGKLPRQLGFVHPGDSADALDLSAEATARFVLGEKLAAGVITAVAIHPSGISLPVPAHHWRTIDSATAMQSGFLEPSVLGLPATDVSVITVLLAIDKVAAALGFRLVPEEPTAPTTVDAWMRDYATRFLAKGGRPPSRDNEAVPDAQEAGFGMNKAREAYARLPPHLKVSARKPKKS
jgi:hypothetical protein